MTDNNKKTENKQSNWFTICISILVGAILSASVFYFGMDIILSNFLIIGFIFLFAILVSSILIIIYLRNPERVHFKIFGIKKEEFENSKNSISQILKNLKKGDINKIDEDINYISKSGFSLISTWTIRNLIFRTLQILFLGFAGLIGSAILLSQNKILEQQTAFFTEESIDGKISKSIEIIYSEKGGTGRQELAVRDYIRLMKKKSSKLNNYKINLKKADLSYLDLRGIDFNHVRLGSAILNETNLSNITIDSSDLTFADLQGTYLNNSKIKDSDLSATKFGSAFQIEIECKNGFRFLSHGLSKLENLKIQQCTIKQTNFSYCDLRSVKFENNTWGETEYEEPIFEEAILIGVNLPEYILERAKRNGAITNIQQIKDKISELESCSTDHKFDEDNYKYALKFYKDILK